jgi:CBS domain-containing protein
MAKATAGEQASEGAGQVRRAGGSPAPEARARGGHDPLPGHRLDDTTARDQPLGWITDRGLLFHLEDEHPLGPVRDAIAEEAVGVTPGTTAREIATKLAQARTTRLLVVPTRGHLPEGVVSALDLVSVTAR